MNKAYYPLGGMFLKVLFLKIDLLGICCVCNSPINRTLNFLKILNMDKK
jgi:hypothetical protein